MTTPSKDTASKLLERPVGELAKQLPVETVSADALTIAMTQLVSSPLTNRADGIRFEILLLALIKTCEIPPHQVINLLKLIDKNPSWEYAGVLLATHSNSMEADAWLVGTFKRSDSSLRGAIKSLVSKVRPAFAAQLEEK